MAKNGKSIHWGSVLIGVAVGVVVSHVFKSAVDSIYTKIPVLGSMSYYGGSSGY